MTPQSNQNKILNLMHFLEGEGNVSPYVVVPHNPYNDAELNATIVKSSDRLYEAISHPHAPSFSWFALLIPVVTGLVVASAAFLYNKLHWYSVRKRESRIKVAESMIDLVTTLDEIAVDYWLKNFSKRFSRESKMCEIKIKAHLNLFNSLVPSLCSEIASGKREENKTMFEGLHSEIYDLITGDDFESTSRKSDRVKADKISNKLLKLRVELVKLCA